MCNTISGPSHILPHLPTSRVSSLSRTAFLEPNLWLQRQHQVLYNLKQEGELARPGVRKDTGLMGIKAIFLVPSPPVPTAGRTHGHLGGTLDNVSGLNKEK